MRKSFLALLPLPALLIFTGCHSGPDPATNNPWFAAAKTGTESGLTAASNSGANINERNRDKDTPLHIAVNANNGPVVIYLISHGADLEARNDDLETPLIIAADHNRNQIALDLIAAGANVNAIDEDGRTALIHAAEDGNLTILDALLAKNADVNLTDKYGWTAAHYAAADDRAEALKRLIDAKADLTMRSGRKETPLMVAMRKEKIAAVRVIQDHLAGAGPQSHSITTVPSKPANATPGNPLSP